LYPLWRNVFARGGDHIGLDRIVDHVINEKVIDLAADEFCGFLGGEDHSQHCIQLAGAGGSGVARDDLVAIKSGEAFVGGVMVAGQEGIIVIDIHRMPCKHPCGNVYVILCVL